MGISLTEGSGKDVCFIRPKLGLVSALKNCDDRYSELVSSFHKCISPNLNIYTFLFESSVCLWYLFWVAKYYTSLISCDFNVIFERQQCSICLLFIFHIIIEVGQHYTSRINYLQHLGEHMSGWAFSFLALFCYCLYASGYSRVRLDPEMLGLAQVQACDKNYHWFLNMASTYRTILLDLTKGVPDSRCYKYHCIRSDGLNYWIVLRVFASIHTKNWSHPNNNSYMPNKSFGIPDKRAFTSEPRVSEQVASYNMCFVITQ